MILCFTAQAVGCLTPRRRPSSTDEMPFFAVTIRWMAANQSVSGSLVAWKIVPAVGEVPASFLRQYTRVGCLPVR